MRQPYPRLSAFRFLDLFGEWDEANKEIETHRSVLVCKPKVRASAFALCATADRSRGWKLQNSGAGAPRERNSIWRFDALMRKKCTEGDTNAAHVIAPSPLAG